MIVPKPRRNPRPRIPTGAALALAALLGACASTPPAVDDPRVAIEAVSAGEPVTAVPTQFAAAETSPAEAAPRGFCGTPVPTCADGDVLTATLCTITAHDGRGLPLEDVLQTWGRTPCLARAALHDLACARNPHPGLDPRLYHEVTCVPDPSNRECPVGPVDCEAAEGEAPVVCRALEYEGEALQPEQQFAAQGRNACEARTRLAKAACVNQLKPSAISNMSCVPAKEPSCASGDASCHAAAAFLGSPVF